MSVTNVYSIDGRSAHGRRKKLWLLICVGISTLLGVGQVFVAYADPGDLDPTFDLDGKVTTNFSGYPDEAHGVAIQTDGKIVVVGFAEDPATTTTDFAMTRYNPDGTLDPTFAGDGTATTDFLIGDNDAAQSVAIQADGKIVVAGYSTNIFGETDFALARYTTSGFLDTSFSGDGIVGTDMSGDDDEAHGVAIQADGKIVAVGRGYLDFAVARYNSNGTLDTTFDGDGKVTTDFRDIDVAYSVAIQEDDKLVVAGTARDVVADADFALARYNTDGSLDTGFAGNGKLTTDFLGDDDGARGVVIQDGCKIVAGGYADDAGDGDFALARYNFDGTLDTTFGGDGKVTTGFSDDDEANGVAIQTDSKIVMAGFARDGTEDSDFALARFNFDGTLDTTFSGDGRVTTNLSGDDDYANGVAIQADGKIVAAGSAIVSSGDSDFAMTRYNTTGTLDTTLGEDGEVTTNFAGDNNRANDVAMQSDGKIVVVGSAEDAVTLENDFAVARYNSDGSLDTGFNSDGKVTTDFGANDEAYSVAIQADGKIVVAGHTQPFPITNDDDIALARYNSNGSLDTTFDGDGILTTEFTIGSYESAIDVAIQADGKIVVAGYHNSGGGNHNFAVARYNSNGSLDTGFDGDGKVTTDFNNNDDYAFSVAIQADGKIVAAGYATNGSFPNFQVDFALARYNSNGSLDLGFDFDGKILTDWIGENDVANDVAIQGDGKIVAAGYATTVVGDVDFGLTRYNSNGSLDTSFGVNGRVGVGFLGGDDLAQGVSIQSDGKIVTAGNTVSAGGDRGVALARNNADGSLDNTFGGDGKVTTDWLGAGFARDVAIQSDGKIVTAGYTDNNTDEDDFAVARYEIAASATPTATAINTPTSTATPTCQPVATATPATPSPTSIGIAKGDLDLAFDMDGKVTTDFLGNSDLASGVAIQVDGKIVAAGYALDVNDEIDFAVARYNPNGSLDTTFDGDGRVTTDFFGGYDVAHDVAIQADGKIVVAGNAISADGDMNAALVRYNPDGSLDTTFSGNGKINTDFAGDDDYGYSVAIQPNGKIVVAGHATGCARVDFALARYNTDGTLDTTFDGDGKVTTDFSRDYDYAYGVAIQANGKIVAAGSVRELNSDSDFGLARYNSDGSLDITFSGDGKAITDFAGDYDGALSVAIQANGKIVAAGYGAASCAGSNFGLARYNSDGSLDNVFGGNGKVTTDFAGDDDRANDVTIQADGKVVAVGYAASGSLTDFGLARYNSDGSLDTSFSGDGKVTTNVVGDLDIALAVAIQADGKIVAAGHASTGGGYSDFALARYLGSPAGTPTPTPTCLTVTYVSTDVPKPILDLTTVDSLLTIAGGPTIGTIEVVGISISHTRASDLDVFLISPLGTPVELFTDVCGGQTWTIANTGFDLANNKAFLIGSVCPPGQGHYRPEGNLGVLVGQGSSGTWKLSVTDDAGGNTGVLNGWGLRIGSGACPTLTPMPPKPVDTIQPTRTPTRSVTPTQTTGSATATPTSCPIQFADVTPGNPFYPHVRCLACRGIVNGYPCGGPGEPCNANNDPYFRPAMPVTRGQISKIVALAAGFNDPVVGQTFEDVPPAHNFYTFIEQMALRGVISGYPCGVLIGDPCVPPENRPYFHPGAPASRGQLTKIVSNSAGFQEPVVGETFEDVPPTAIFYAFVERLSSRSIIGGYPCGGPGEPCVPPNNRPYFRPQNNVTRAQTAKVVANTFFPGCYTPAVPGFQPQKQLE